MGELLSVNATCLQLVNALTVAIDSLVAFAGRFV
jgi:hypothetical protein